jgi:hypothetical protein
MVLLWTFMMPAGIPRCPDEAYLHQLYLFLRGSGQVLVSQKVGAPWLLSSRPPMCNTQDILKSCTGLSSNSSNIWIRKYDTILQRQRLLVQSHRGMTFPKKKCSKTFG